MARPQIITDILDRMLSSLRGAADGVAPLDANSKVPGVNLPAQAASWEVLQESILGSNSSGIPLNSVPSGYKAYKLLISCRATTATGGDLNVTVNNITTASYAHGPLGTTGSSPSGASNMHMQSCVSGNSNVPGYAEIDFMPNLSYLAYHIIYSGWYGGLFANTLLGGNYSIATLDTIQITSTVAMIAGSKAILLGLK